ncbi:MAG TPA: POTRA domain-containing protein [Bryobacteraceae bacterium]|nr:POTRA domain-containing protein [Bryobacteraceae bacterium]
MGSQAKAQVSAFEGRPIVDVQFSPPAPLDPADLARAQTLRKGEPLHAADVAFSIDALFATGRFEDIVVEAEPSGNGVIVRFVTKNTRFVGGVTVDGKVMQPPNRGQVANTAQFTLGGPFREEDVTHAVDSIRHLLQANGLYDASVTPDVQRDDNSDLVFIRFQVKEGKRAKYEMPVISGDTKLSDATILRATGWRLPIIHWWRQVTDSLTHKGVQGVLGKYAQQDRLTAKVELTKLDYDASHRRVQPNLNIDAGPKVTVKAVETKVSKRVLKRYVPIFQQHAVDNDLLVEGKRNLRDYFENQGYYDAEIDFRVQGPQNDLETIEYVIARGSRFKLVRVDIAGNKYFDTETIRERMFMAPASFLRLRHGRYSEAFRRKDEENVANLYKANGFRDVKVTSTVDRDYQDKQGDMAVTLKIDEGPQWVVDNVAMEGVSQMKEADVTSQLASADGQPFSEVNLAADREHVLTYYYSHGFPAANFAAKWQPSGTPNHVNVVYTVTEGSRQYVRDVKISGLRTTRPHLVQQAMTLKAGDPLSPVEQTEIQKALYDLGIFARVDTAIENPDGDTDHKYVLYHIEEANRYNIAVGVGAQVARFGTPSNTSLAAPTGTTGFSPEFSLTATRLNFLGMGHMVTLRGLYSSIEKRGSISYLQPRFHNIEGRNVTYSLVYDNTLDVRTFASRREEASVQVSQQFSKSLNGLFQFAYRRVSVSSVIIPVLLVPQILQPVRLGMLSARLVQDRRDNPADPHKGIYTTVDLSMTGRFLGSQRSFGRALVRNATYYSLTKNLVLARQTQFGLIQAYAAPPGISAAESVPLPERFFAGGADSLRAFPYNQAGPRDLGTPLVSGGMASAPTGFPLGGNALFINNVEMRFPFIGDNIQGVFFHDMGNVYSSIGNLSLRFSQKNLQDFDYAVQAVGFGIRYRTPVGPIRLDLAYSINPPSFVGFSGTPVQLLQCNPGLPSSQLPGYCQPTQQNTGHFQFFFSIGQAF